MQREVNSSLFLQDYFSEDTHDEMFTRDMQIKPGWKSLSDHINQLGSKELSARQKEIDWMLSENGVTYNVYNDPKGLNRPWNLNIVPFVIEKEEWNRVSEGLKQRVHLLDLILKDIYGERKLISKGILPYEIIYGHRGFLRQCNGISYKTEKRLSIYASDLSRGPDGRMWIVNDRTQAPSGMGYALENRTTSTRVLSDVYQNLHVKKLSGFFRDFNNLLIQSSPKKREVPNIIILTPGPHNETYFEHAYLASFLGYPLVQGYDLVVRNSFLYMKSLNGLKRVDVVLRRVDDAFMDPLELREDSHLGVAGLLDVVRKQNVTIINPIGSGVLENSGLIPFMPAIANYFLGEKLMLPQIATWWCGQEKERKFVLSNLNNHVIKRIDRSNRESIFFCEYLSNKEKSLLKDRIEKEPYLYVAQEKINFSTVPNFTKGSLEPRNMVCRAFALAKEDQYTIMPGGLIRVAPERGNLRVSNQRGGTSKDFWVLTDKEEKETTHIDGIAFSKQTLAGLEDLPSQTAENLYWAGRYISRSLFVCRFLRMTLRQLIKSEKDQNPLENEKLNILLKGVTQITSTFPGFVGDKKNKPVTDVRSELEAVLFDKNKMGSLANTMMMFTNSYYSIRNLWSSDMWHVFKIIQKSWSDLEKEGFDGLSYNEIIKFLDKTIVRIIAFMGLIEESILVNQGLLLYFIGLNLEQAVLTISKCRALLTVEAEGPVAYEVLESFLNSHESLNIYRYSYRSYVTIENVIQLILLDATYSRSLTYLVSRILKDVKKLPASGRSMELLAYEKYVFEAYSKLRLTSVEKLTAIDPENIVFRKNLAVLLTEMSNLLYQTSQSVSDIYFSHTLPQKQLTFQSFPI
ncbi:circularly permuted type 2 ATP-grasp protein [Aquimarina sp. ERC-38]|uniref:circularly permuted type 2 ATP-grasp protein n=1 Tax=Aquimarina sp. ERC-38 TaxID=2949996 RepID=UPI0022473EAB|nr:circularly permuted type 2 ATP-grasp protein [Aquimarina sp. ERC-38]UZO82361.1 circularly permuted type 2 ATP-grasp protein [Aquimarina sp. ERC-38]